MGRETIDHCAFCGKSRSEVEHLVEGPTAAICDECMGTVGDVVQGRKLRTVEEDRDRLRAVAGEMAEALDRVEAAMSFIEPRNEKAEYLETLEVVRAALAKWKDLG